MSAIYRHATRQAKIERNRRVIKRAIGLALLAVLIHIYGSLTQNIVDSCEFNGYSHAYCVKLAD